MDELDENIIRLLQSENTCKPKTTKIAESLKIPASTVHSRIKKMEKKGIIENYSADINAEKIGKNLTVFALVKLEYPSSAENIEFDEITAEKIGVSSDKIQEVHAMTGDWELLIKIKAENADDYYRIAKECIAPSGEIKKVKGLFALNTVKESNNIFP